AFLMKELKPIVVPKLIKVIFQGSKPIGMLIGLPDYSAALKTSSGFLKPQTISNFLKQKWNPDSAVMVVIAIKQAYQNSGGVALLISEMAQTIHQLGIQKIELINNADSAKRMRSDFQTMGFKPHKTHRVYEKQLSL
ncbi:MAG: hypothetical protein AAGD96_12890, partial [Chloroflexota bacterium]